MKKSFDYLDIFYKEAQLKKEANIAREIIKFVNEKLQTGKNIVPETLPGNAEAERKQEVTTNEAGEVIAVDTDPNIYYDEAKLSSLLPDSLKNENMSTIKESLRTLSDLGSKIQGIIGLDPEEFKKEIDSYNIAVGVLPAIAEAARAIWHEAYGHEPKAEGELMQDEAHAQAVEGEGEDKILSILRQMFPGADDQIKQLGGISVEKSFRDNDIQSIIKAADTLDNLGEIQLASFLDKVSEKMLARGNG